MRLVVRMVAVFVLMEAILTMVDAVFPYSSSQGVNSLYNLVLSGFVAMLVFVQWMENQS